MFIVPSCLSTLGCDLNAPLGWQRGSPRNASLAPESYGGRVLLGWRFRPGSLPYGFQEHLAGKLDWISRSVLCHALSMPCLAPRSKRGEFQTDPLPKSGMVCKATEGYAFISG